MTGIVGPHGTWQGQHPNLQPQDPAPRRIVIIGAPRTKKNHGKAVIRRAKKGGQPCPNCLAPLQADQFPSKPWTEWVKTAEVWIDGAQLVRSGKLVMLLPIGEPARVWHPITESLNCKAIFYRDRDSGDWIGYMQGLGDFLQARRVIDDDVQVKAGDGSRLALTSGRPRVDLELRPLWRSQ